MIPGRSRPTHPRAPASTPRPVHAGLLALVAACSWVRAEEPLSAPEPPSPSAAVPAAVVERPRRSAPPLAVYEAAILGRDIFGAYDDPEAQREGEEAALSDLPLVLLGTVVAEPAEWSKVLVAEVRGRRQGEAEWFDLGEEVAPGFLLAEVRQGEALLLGPDGVEELLRLGEGEAAEAASRGRRPRVSRKALREGVKRRGRRYTLDEERFEEAARVPELITAGALAEPGDGGLDIKRAPRTSVLRRLGVRKGDRVERVGGQDVETMGQLQEALADGIEEEGFQIRLRRRGRSVRYRYRLGEVD